jgi:hypothetical protein
MLGRFLVLRARRDRERVGNDLDSAKKIGALRPLLEWQSAESRVEVERFAAGAEDPVGLGAVFAGGLFVIAAGADDVLDCACADAVVARDLADRFAIPRPGEDFGDLAVRQGSRPSYRTVHVCLLRHFFTGGLPAGR